MREDAVHGSVHVDCHRFWLAERGSPAPSPAPSPANGLVAPRPGAVEIWAGTHTGDVSIQVCTLGAPPRIDDLDVWDDVVEVDVESLAGELLVTSFFAHLPRELPNLASSGPGRYRIRFHVRGRDSGSSYDSFAPDEQYLVTSWPVTQSAPEYAHKHTDRYGQLVRENVASA